MRAPRPSFGFSELTESDAARRRRSPILHRTAAAAEELFEAGDHGANVGEDGTELDEEQNDADGCVLRPEAEDQNQDERAKDGDGSDAALFVEHLADLPFEPGQEERPVQHTKTRQQSERPNRETKELTLQEQA